jgi:hypothetical protein
MTRIKSVLLLAVLLLSTDSLLAWEWPWAPRVPVHVAIRKSLLGGYVAQFTNESDRSLVVYMVFENANTKSKQEGNLKIDAGKTEEVGWLNGWIFERGETVTISHEGYKTVVWTISPQE